MQQGSSSRLSPSKHTDSGALRVGTKMNGVSQHMDLSHKQVCIDLEKATQIITLALQNEVGRNQELWIVIRRLEEKEAETGRSLSEQKLQIDELQKRLKEKDHSLTQANQTVTSLKNELRDLHQHLQSQPSNSSPFHSDQLKTAEGSLAWSEQLVSPEVQSLLESSDDQIPLESSDDQIPPVSPDDQKVLLISADGHTFLEEPVSGIREENTAHGYEECSQSEGADPRMDNTSTADVQFEQIQTPLVSSDGQRLLEAPVSEDGYNEVGDDDEYGENSHSGKDASPSPSMSCLESEKSKPYSCSECGKTFRFWCRLKQHQSTHMERPYCCSQCGKTFINGGDLNRHQRIHTGARPYPCAQCGKSFTDGGNLKRHQLIHTGERPYQCTQCDRTFTDGESLKRHQQIHTGDAPYHCNQCGKSFNRKISLKQHIHIHSGERPYHCTQCGKSFTRKETLSRHQRIHTGERPYHCTQCGKSFTQKRSFRLHHHSHSGERSYHSS